MHIPVGARPRAVRSRRRLGAVTLTTALVAAGGIAIAVPAIAADPIGETGALTVTYQRDVGEPVLYNPDRLDNNDGWVNNPPMMSTDVNGVALDPAVPDFQEWFDGGTVRTLPGNPWGYHVGDDMYPHFMGVMDPIPDPVCDADQVTVQIKGNMINVGPGTTWGSTGTVAINHLATTATYQWWGGEFAPGHQLGFNRSATVPLADLQNGDVRVSVSLESYQAIPEPGKAWDLFNFGATYTVHCNPLAQDADVEVKPGETGFLTLDGKVITDRVDPDWTTLRLVNDAGDEVTELTIDGVGTYTVDVDGKQVVFEAHPDYAGGQLPTVPYRITTTALGTPGFQAQTAEALLNVTVTAEPGPYPSGSPKPTPSESPVGAPIAGDLNAKTTGTAAVSVDPVAGATAGPNALINPASVRLLNAAGEPVTELEVSGQGTFVVDPTSGVITFTPFAGFVGLATASYVLADDDGQSAQATIEIDVAAANTGGTTTPPAPAAAGDKGSDSNSGALARTGADTDALPVTLGAALTVMLLGAGAVLVARRRRTNG